jgi:hypothetical protein
MTPHGITLCEKMQFKGALEYRLEKGREISGVTPNFWRVISLSFQMKQVEEP